MHFIEILIKLQIMVEDFILLIVFYMAAHHNDGLPHQKHKEPAEQRHHQYHNSKKRNLAGKAHVFGIYKTQQCFYKRIISFTSVNIRAFTEMGFHQVENKSGYLWGKDGKIVRKDNEYNSCHQPDPVLPEVFVYCL